MKQNILHIIALNIPFPANYGGVIDIYYKLEELYRQGVKIILHCFEYDRERAEELNAICHQVYYYPRKTGFLANISCYPYNVIGRKHPELINRLLQDDYPILFEGLHSCYYLSDKRLANRFKVVRTCNIEHHYYRSIASAEHTLLKKGFYYLEAIRFALYQSVLKHSDLILPVSLSDEAYLKNAFPEKESIFIPCFHANKTITSRLGLGDFIFYHANLMVQENETAVLYMIEHIFAHLPYKCVIAGIAPRKRLLDCAKKYDNVTVIANPSDEEMSELTHSAQIHLLYTFQGTGLKLKLLNSLFAGRHVVVNPTMLNGSGLDSICHISHAPEEAIELCKRLMETPFTEEDREHRAKVLTPNFNNAYQAEKLCHLIEQKIATK